VNSDLSKARLGEGVIWTRLEDHIRAFAINETRSFGMPSSMDPISSS
jgi:hypothetical protein